MALGHYWSAMFKRLQAIARLMEEARTPAEVLTALDSVTGPSLQVVGARCPSKLYLTPSLPQDFRKALSEGSERFGPSVMARLSDLGPSPFTVAEAMRSLQPTGDDRWVFDIFRNHGIRDGLYCSYDNNWNIVYVSDRALDGLLSPEMRMVLDALGKMAVKRLKDLTSPTAPKARLSPRENTVLLHLSEGLSTAEIAARLALNETSVKTFVARASKKLGAANQLHAVSLAIRQRLI